VLAKVISFFYLVGFSVQLCCSLSIIKWTHLCVGFIQ